MAQQTILLKALLKDRHLQGHRAFCREYDKVARRIDPDLVGGYPSKAQFYRWLSGELLGLPYPDHCRVLEGMFPGWKAARLFEPSTDGAELLPAQQSTTPNAPGASGLGIAPGDIEAVFPNRSDFMHSLPPRELFDGAKRIRMVGLSLNLVCQHYPDQALLDLLESGTEIGCLFLDPDGAYIGGREKEESLRKDTLRTLTRINIDALRRIATKLSTEAQDRLRIRTYDEVIRFNITIIDDARCVVQPYLPHARGVESPTFVLRNSASPAGVYGTFSRVFESIWARGQDVVS